MKTDNGSILWRAYSLCSQGFDQVALEVVLKYLDRELRDGNFENVNQFLGWINVERLAPSVLLAILTITWHGKEQLPRRSRFLTRAERQMIIELGEQRALKLLETRR